MSIVAKAINYQDEQRMIKELKDLGKPEIVNYIQALKRAIEGQHLTNRMAINKVRELSKEKDSSSFPELISEVQAIIEECSYIVDGGAVCERIVCNKYTLIEKLKSKFGSEYFS